MIPPKQVLRNSIVALNLFFVISCQVDEDITLSAFSKPSVPQNIAISDITSTSLVVRWNPANAAEAVSDYVVYQNNVQVAVDSATTYMASNLQSESEYSFSVRAINVADKVSDYSQEVTVKTSSEQETVPNPILNPNSKADHILVFTKTSGYRHSSIEKGVSTLVTLCAENDIEVTVSEDASMFNSSDLNGYNTVVFLNTSGDVLNESQQVAFENFIKTGGSFMGVHAATDTELEWTWYGELVGANFDSHPDIQNANLNVQEGGHNATDHLEPTWIRNDEWYNFSNVNANITVLLNLDETTYEGGTMGENHPIAWYHEFDGGRSFYTGGGHTSESYDEPDFQKHLLGGILYCLKR